MICRNYGRATQLDSLDPNDDATQPSSPEGCHSALHQSDSSANERYRLLWIRI